MRFTLIVALCLAFLLSGCSNKETPPNTKSTQAPTIVFDSTEFLQVPTVVIQPTEPPSATINEYSTIDYFIDSYNSISSDSLTNISSLDIHNKDYRTEYRLGAFKNVIGKKCTAPSGQIEIINYGVRSNDCIRIYASTETLDSAVNLCTTIVHILDNSISDEEISSQFEPLDSVPSANFYLGTAGYISGYIDTDYANGGIAGYNLMVDCTKISFIG